MAREGYLVNAGEETIHPDAQAPMSPKQKRQNWWYYNKFILLGVVLVALLVGSIIYSVASQVKPDYTIALMTSYTMPESGLQQLRDCIPLCRRPQRRRPGPGLGGELRDLRQRDRLPDAGGLHGEIHCRRLHQRQHDLSPR